MTSNISQSHHGILYAGTSFFLRCVITLNDVVTKPVIVINEWTRNGISVPNSLSNDTIITESLKQNDLLQYEATLHFNPLDNTDDSGEYSCNFNILSNISDYEYVRNTSANTSTTITVQGTLYLIPFTLYVISNVVINVYDKYFSYCFLIAIPSPIINIITTGIARPGKEYNITCIVEVIDRLVVTPIVIWIKDSVNTSLVSNDLNIISVPSVLSNISDTRYSLSLFFSSLNTSDAGQYTCKVTIAVNEINFRVTNSNVQNLSLQSKSKNM